MIRLIPPYVLEFLLFVVLVVFAGVVLSAVRRRWKVPPLPVAALLPDLATEVRVRATIRRVFRDPDQGLYLLEATIGTRKLTFCAVDYEANAAHYPGAIGQSEDFALYALGTLALGGAEAMRAQIADLDKVAEPLADLTRLVPAGRFPNDYAVIGRIVSWREDMLSGAAVTIYRMQVEAQFFIDVAVEPNSEPPFAPDTLVHGSARLFGARVG